MPTTAEAAGELLTPDDVAAQLGVSVWTVRRLYQCGELQSVRVGRLVRIPPAALAAYVSANTSPASPAERTST